MVLYIQKILILIAIITMISCHHNLKKDEIRIGFLHHSTGQCIWEGNRSTFLSIKLDKISHRVAWKFKKSPSLPRLFRNYNKEQHKNYKIDDIVFPKKSPYGWSNYPYDYYNIWVKHSGDMPFMEEPTLEILSKKYQTIILKHCFPVCNIQADSGKGDINSDHKTIVNYKLQYLGLREKFHSFPHIKFILLTGAAQVSSNIKEPEALRAKEFFSWVIKEWDIPNDNIYIWDLFSLQTEGGIYFSEDYSKSKDDSHPNELFSERASNLLFSRIIDIIENDGSRTNLIGEEIK